MPLSRPIVYALFAVWLGAIVLSFMAATDPPTGDGFTRGLNRITGFLQWQLAAGIVGLGLWIGVRSAPKGDWIKWLGRIPGWWAAFLVLAVVVWILIGVVGSQMSKNRALEIEQGGAPAATTAPLATTEPAD